MEGRGLNVNGVEDVQGVLSVAPAQLPQAQQAVDAAEYHDVRLHELGQLLPLIDSFVILSQMPLIVLILCLCLPVTRLRPLPTCKNININWHREK